MCSFGGPGANRWVVGRRLAQNGETSTRTGRVFLTRYICPLRFTCRQVARPRPGFSATTTVSSGPGSRLERSQIIFCQWFTATVGKTLRFLEAGETLPGKAGSGDRFHPQTALPSARFTGGTPHESADLCAVPPCCGLEKVGCLARLALICSPYRGRLCWRAAAWFPLRKGPSARSARELAS